jgi:hypothetical protein
MTVQEHPNGDEFRPVRAASEALDAHLTSAIAELSQGEPAVTAPSPTGFKPGEISSLFTSLRARKEAMIAEIQKNASDVADVLAVGEQMSAGLKADADALRAELGQLTNFPPA